MADVNLTVAAFPRLNAAVRRVRNNAGVGRILFVGDSTSSSAWATAQSKSVWQKTADLVNATVRSQSSTVWFTDPGAGWLDGRVTVGTGWAYPNTLANPSLGSGNPASGGWTAPTSATGNLSFAFTQSIDRIDIWYAQQAGAGTFTVDVDGGSTLATINAAATNAMQVAHVTCPAGVHTINLHPPTVGTVQIIGVEAWLSTSPALLISSAGGSGLVTNNAAGEWTDAALPWSKLNAISTYAPDLTLISLGINDAAASVAASTFQTNLDLIVAAALTTGDVIIESCVPSHTAPWTTFEPQYIAPEAAIATARGCGFFDTSARFVNWTTANGNGYMFDDLHPNDSGYAFWAGLLNAALVGITTLDIPGPPPELGRMR